MTEMALRRPWTARVLTLFPEMFPGPLGHSLAGKALAGGSWRLEAMDIRAFAADRHRSVDDAPFGGAGGGKDGETVLLQFAGDGADPVAGDGVGLDITMDDKDGKLELFVLCRSLRGGPGPLFPQGRSSLAGAVPLLPQAVRKGRNQEAGGVSICTQRGGAPADFSMIARRTAWAASSSSVARMTRPRERSAGRRRSSRCARWRLPRGSCSAGMHQTPRTPAGRLPRLPGCAELIRLPR